MAGPEDLESAEIANETLKAVIACLGFEDIEDFQEAEPSLVEEQIRSWHTYVTGELAR